jgi:disulfide bond formation protein DsbB
MPVATAPSVSRTTFVASCSACHGEDGEGVEGLGKALDTSAFVRSKSDKELTTFIKTGRPIWDAENTTGLDMPPKGGNPALTDDDLANIVSYIRVLQD